MHQLTGQYHIVLSSALMYVHDVMCRNVELRVERVDSVEMFGSHASKSGSHRQALRRRAAARVADFKVL